MPQHIIRQYQFPQKVFYIISACAAGKNWQHHDERIVGAFSDYHVESPDRNTFKVSKIIGTNITKVIFNANHIVTEYNTYSLIDPYMTSQEPIADIVPFRSQLARLPSWDDPVIKQVRDEFYKLAGEAQEYGGV